MNFLKKFSISLSALILLCFTSSCTDQMRDVQDQTTDIAPEAIQTQTYYAQISNTSPEVYAIEVSTLADGSVLAERKIVPYATEHDYIDGVIIGAASVQEAESGIHAQFSEEYWLVPFDPESPESLLPSLAGVTVTCTCDGSGACDTKGTASSSGVTFHCVSRGCNDDCSGTITVGGRAIEIGGLSGPVLIINSKNITVN